MLKIQQYLRLSPIVALSAVATVACVTPVDDGSVEQVGQVTSAVDLTQPVSVRFISIAGDSCQPMSESDARTSVDLLNEAGGISGLEFRFSRYDVLPLRKDVRDAVMTVSDMQPLAIPMGISSAKLAEIDDYMTRHWPANERYLRRWLDVYRRKAMPDQVVVWQGCDGGVEMTTGAFIYGKGNVVHEVGHGFNLSHSFSMTMNCGAWDLIYAARGRGRSNVYFTSKQDCDTFRANNSGYTLYRLDPREGEPEGAIRKWSGSLARVQYPRCSTCGVGVGIDDPLTDGVERYATGDAQITGYARLMNGLGAVNAMTYCSSSGCPNSSLLDRTFYSASQIDIMKTWAATEDWVFDQGNPITVLPPAQGCSWIDPNEGLYRDQPFYSCDGRFRLYLQADGNLVLSQKASDGQFKTILWKTNPLVDGTDTTGIALVMQGDGNLVVYDGHPNPLWATGTNGNPGLYMKVTNDGDFQVRAAHQIYWHTNTGGH